MKFSWLLLFLLSGVSCRVTADYAPQTYDTAAVVWAVNIGGGEYLSAEGVKFSADDNPGGFVGTLDKVPGSAGAKLFHSYRTGPLQLEKTLANGVYDLTLYFSEPDDFAVGQRVFNVSINDDLAIEALDLSLVRGRSALVRTVSGIEVSNGNLRLELQGLRLDPVLSGLLVRARKPEMSRWRLVWSDEFDYQGSPDPEKWQIDRWPARKVNNEEQAYTDRPCNVRVADGSLVLEAHQEDYQGANYTSGRVHTRGLGDFLYGRVDIRARLPGGQGTWSALWMLPSDPFRYATNCDSNDEWQGNAACDAWPNSGEIDIMEHVGYDMRHIHGTVHNRIFSGGGADQQNASIDVPDVHQNYHVYSLEWTPERILLFVDGVAYYSYLNTGGEDWQAWPYDHPFHLIMNLAVGGFWGLAGGPIDQSIFPASMEVDYVRVYDKN